MTKPIINRQYALQRLQRKESWHSLKADIDNYSALKQELIKILMEKQDDSERNETINASEHTKNLVMFFFLDALSSHDFTTMKNWLPRLFEMRESLHDVYFDVLKSCCFVLEPNKDLGELNGILKRCQIDLINLDKYQSEDVWLLVMLACLKPINTLCLLSNQWYWNRRLADITSGIANESEFKTCKRECEAVNAKIAALAECYQSKNIDLLNTLHEKEEELRTTKADMEWQNTLFNIVNVFAWLPLLLTNLKRACFGQSPRLFHYIGSEYAQTLSLRMIDAVPNKEIKQTKINTQSAPQEAQSIKYAAQRIKIALQTPNDPDIYDIATLNALINNSRLPFTDASDLSKLSENKHEQIYLYRLYCLINAQILIRQKKFINKINHWLCWSVEDPELMAIAERLKADKNMLVKDVLDQTNGDVFSLLIQDRLLENMSIETQNQIKNNEHACSIIKRLIMTTLPIYKEDFKVLSLATKGLSHVIALMNERGWLKRYTTTLVFETYSSWEEGLQLQLDAATDSDISADLKNSVEAKLRALCTAKKLKFPESLRDDSVVASSAAACSML